jgi:hypothetical protein
MRILFPWRLAMENRSGVPNTTPVPAFVKFMRGAKSGATRVAIL